MDNILREGYGWRTNGVIYEVFDIENDKWRIAGYTTFLNGERIYHSLHREKLYIWNSVGCTKGILKDLYQQQISKIMHQIGLDRTTAKYYFSTVEKHLNNGRTLNAKNERGSTLHISLKNMEVS